MNVVLQAGLGVEARQIHLARRHQKMAMDEVAPAGAPGCAGKYGPKYVEPSLLQPPRHVDPRILFVGELDVRIGLVVAQQNVETRLVLLDQVVLERQRLFFVIDQDVVDIARFGDQRPGLDVGKLVVGKVAAHAQPQALGLADVDYPPGSILVQEHSWDQGATRSLLSEFYRRQYNLITSRWLGAALFCLMTGAFAAGQDRNRPSSNKRRLRRTSRRSRTEYPFNPLLRRRRK